MAYKFKMPPPKTKKTCPECGVTFQGSAEDDVCIQCYFHQKHPETAPKYWTWTKGPRNSWKAVCTWPGNEDPPQGGETITVHRKDGSISQETVGQPGETWYDRSANMKIICTVL